jgi:hypothetical protein
MFSFGMFSARALSTARRNVKLVEGSAPLRAATWISRASRVNNLPRAASAAPFLRLIVDHFECPDMPLSPHFLPSAASHRISGAHDFSWGFHAGCGAIADTLIL